MNEIIAVFISALKQQLYRRIKVHVSIYYDADFDRLEITVDHAWVFKYDNLLDSILNGSTSVDLAEYVTKTYRKYLLSRNFY